MKYLVKNTGPNRHERRAQAASNRKCHFRFNKHSGLPELVIFGAKTNSNRSRQHKVRTRTHAN